MSTSSPRSTPELLTLIAEEWGSLMRIVDQLTPEQMTTPDSGGWSPKDNLAHLAEWMRFMKDSYLHKMPAYEAMGIPAETYKQLDENGINAILFERNRARPAEEVLKDLKSTYADVTETLAAMPFADLLKPVRDSGPDKRLALETVVANTSDHFHEHRLTIERSL